MGNWNLSVKIPRKRGGKKGLQQSNPGFHSSRKDALSGQELKGLGHGRLVPSLQEWVCFHFHRSPHPHHSCLQSWSWFYLLFRGPVWVNRISLLLRTASHLCEVRHRALDSCNQSLSEDTVGIFSWRRSNSPWFSVAYRSFTWAR